MGPFGYEVVSLEATGSEQGYGIFPWVLSYEAIGMFWLG